MQRSPVIFWLLVAATVAVSAVAVSGVYLCRAYKEVPSAAIIALCDAWIFGILTVLSIWVVFSPRRRRWVGLMCLVAAVAVVAIVAALAIDFPFWEMAAICGSFVTALTLLLWVVKQTRIWRGGLARRRSSKWQFSVGQLLVLMTVVALLVATLRDSEIVRNQSARGVLFVDVAAKVLLGTTLVLAWARPWHPVLRLAAMLALGGLVDWGADRATSPYSSLAVHSGLIEVLLIFAWLEFGHIIPYGEPTDQKAMPPTAEPSHTT